MKLPIIAITVTVLLTVLIGIVPAQQPARIPMPVNYDGLETSVLDNSRFLTAPAGRNGFVRADGDQLVDQSGNRIRLWGVNLGGPRCFPEPDQAERLAKVFAHLGINVVRMHGLDSDWGRSLIDRSTGDTQSLSAENFERFDYLFAKLKEQGIYVDLNLNVFRNYGPGDGLPNHEDLGVGKGATHFYPQLVALQKDYARGLLQHVNPHTGNAYNNEPAVVVVEIVNENSLVEGWLNGRLVGRDDGSGDVWSPLPVVYAAELNRQFNEWLKTNISAEQLTRFKSDAGIDSNGPLVLLAPEQFADSDRQRFETDFRFIIQTERDFLVQMKTLIKDEIGLKSMLIGDADHNDSVPLYPHILNNAQFDFLDGHGYWQHPSIGSITRTENTAMVNDPGYSTVVQFARTPMAGMPYVISETQHPYPHRYAAEGIPIVAAYAMLQGWDGVLFHEWGSEVYEATNVIGDRGWFNLSADPIKVAELAAVGLMFHRGDIRASDQTITRIVSESDVVDSAKTFYGTWDRRPFFDDAFDKRLPLLQRVVWRTPDRDHPSGTAVQSSVAANDLRSGTGQLRWHGHDRDRGQVTIDSPMTEALIGYTGDQTDWRYEGTRHLRSEVKNDFAVILLSSLDDLPIEESKRLLLTTLDRAADEGLSWRDDLKTVSDFGDGPVSIAPVYGGLRLPGLGKHRWTVTALDALMRPTGVVPKAWQQDGDQWIYLDEVLGTGYLLTR